MTLTYTYSALGVTLNNILFFYEPFYWGVLWRAISLLSRASWILSRNSSLEYCEKKINTL